MMSAMSSKISIYSKSCQVVQQYQNVDKNNYITLPISTDMDSLMIVNNSGQIVPFFYVPPTTINRALVDMITGEKNIASVKKKDTVITGNILSLDTDNVTIHSNNGGVYLIKDYDMINVPNIDFNKEHKLYVQDNNFTLSYIMNKVSWKCIATGVINGTNLYLRLAAKIYNNTEQNILADTVLVCGNIYSDNENENERIVASMAKMAVREDDSATKSMLEDYTKYNLGNLNIYEQNVIELGSYTIETMKIYIHNTGNPKQVRYGYRFTATDFIPNCKINIYSSDDIHNIGEFIGSSNITEKQSGESVDVIIGESTMIRCKSHVIVDDVDNPKQYKLSEHKTWKVVREQINFKLSNSYDFDVPIILEHYVGRNKVVEMGCPELTPIRDDNLVKWHYHVPALSKDNIISCSIVTASIVLY